MDITLNGKEKQVRAGLSLADLLKLGDYVPGRVATMLNGEVVARDARISTVLHEGDTVEVVTFAGGG